MRKTRKPCSSGNARWKSASFTMISLWKTVSWSVLTIFSRASPTVIVSPTLRCSTYSSVFASTAAGIVPSVCGSSLIHDAGAPSTRGF